MIKPDYYSAGPSGTFQIGAWRVVRPDPTKDRFRIDLSLIAYKNGAVDGVTYPSLFFTKEEFPADALAEFALSNDRSLTFLNYHDCRPEDKEKFFGTDFGGEKDNPGETLKNLLCSDGKIKAILNGSFRYVGRHALGEDEATALSEEDVEKASKAWAKRWNIKSND